MATVTRAAKPVPARRRAAMAVTIEAELTKVRWTKTAEAPSRRGRRTQPEHERPGRSIRIATHGPLQRRMSREGIVHRNTMMA